MKLAKRKVLLYIGLLVFFGLVGLGLYFFFVRGGNVLDAAKVSAVSEDTEARLLLEIFDSINKNYWQKVDERELKQLFGLAAAKAVGAPPLPASTTRAQFQDYLASALLVKTGDDKKTATLAVGELVLANLLPFGRNRIFTMAEEKNLRDTVSNINASKDLYAELGVPKDASLADIGKEYEAKRAVLEKEGTPEAKEKMTRISYIKDVLTDEKKKTLYDTNKIEPTLSLKTLSPSTLYLNLSRFSPTTLDEFVTIAKRIGELSGARNLIIDMRGNIGGSFDIVPYLSGFFIGQGQYAFDLFRQGEYIPFKTPNPKLPELGGLKKIIVLLDSGSQSSAELFASVLKKYNKAIVAGETSRGVGTIENTFPLSTALAGNTYTLFLVHSVTIREDGQPIEGRGVEPDINIADKNWKSAAREKLEDSALVNLLGEVLASHP